MSQGDRYRFPFRRPDRSGPPSGSTCRPLELVRVPVLIFMMRTDCEIVGHYGLGIGREIIFDRDLHRHGDADNPLAVDGYQPGLYRDLRADVERLVVIGYTLVRLRFGEDRECRPRLAKES